MACAALAFLSWGVAPGVRFTKTVPGKVHSLISWLKAKFQRSASVVNAPELNEALLEQYDNVEDASIEMDRADAASGLQARDEVVAHQYDMHGEVSTLKEAHRDEVAVLEAAYQHDVAALKAAHLEEVAAYRDEVAALKAAHLEEVAAYQHEVAALEAAHKDAL